MLSILNALAARRAFIIYRAADKSPVNPAHADPASSWANSDAQNPATWLTSDEAMAWTATLGAGYGVGIVLRPEYGIFCVDIDGALVDGAWSPLATAFLTRFAGCYAEVSMSGSGLHIFGSYVGAPPVHKTKNVQLHIELYTDLRYIALTGTNAVGDASVNATMQLHQFAADYFTQTAEDAVPGEWTDGPHPDWSGDVDDGKLIEKALKSKSLAAKFGGGGATFFDLWHATDALTVHMPASPNSNKDCPYDQSSADMSLANHLAFWTGNDCERMLELMQLSALKRDKWEQREDYLRDTIVKACARQKTFASTGRHKPVAAPVQAAPPPPWEAQPVEAHTAAPTPQVGQDGLAATVGAPELLALPLMAPPDISIGAYMASAAQTAIFDGCTYVQDVHQVMTADGLGLDKQRFDVTYGGGRIYEVRPDQTKPSDSAWDAFTKSGIIEFPKVRGMYFDPTEAANVIKVRDGQRWINSWVPVDIRAIHGDVTPFIKHLQILFPQDWRVLLNYLKWIVQNKGRKCMWWPFLQGVPGNGKSWISATVEYCMGRRYTQKPTPKNMDSNFNSSLYGCLFLALEDVKIADDYGTMWETIKPMITQDSLEIEFKGVDKVTREICFNGIMNSNHKAGIRKTPDDRRIGSFFSQQQHQTHLQRDGLTQDYFTGPNGVVTWGKADGWAHVAYYLMNDPVSPDFRTDYAPVTSSTAEHILVSFGMAEQEIIEKCRQDAAGFAGGWINSMAVDDLLTTTGRARAIPRAQRGAMIESLGYQAHPRLPEGRPVTALSDKKRPVLYVANDHTTLAMSDPKAIQAAYEAAQKPK